jgi:lysozyme family protein
MASINNTKKFIAYIRQWEGGLSNAPGDIESAYPAPGTGGYHTNKGVTWRTFVGSAPKGGYSASPELFMKMPDDIWLKIFKVNFWDFVLADKINSQAIAELIVDWVWGSGPGASIPYVQRYLVNQGEKISVDGGFGPMTLAALNRQIAKKGEKKVFEDLYKIRYDFIDNLGKTAYGAPFRTGWLNRLKAFYNMSLTTVKENPGTTTIVGLLLVSGVIYYAYKYGDLQIFGNGVKNVKIATSI